MIWSTPGATVDGLLHDRRVGLGVLEPDLEGVGDLADGVTELTIVGNSCLNCSYASVWRL